MTHLLSIIIPIYNAEKYMRPCIESILNQTFENIELILVDDGSTDNSSSICDEFQKKDRRVQVIHKKNGGCSSARNLGIENATGDLIAFVDADDQLDPDMYEILIDNLDKTNADVSACTLIRENDVTNISLRNHFEDEIETVIILNGQKEIYESITRKQNSIEGFVWNKVWKKDIIGSKRFGVEVAIVDDAFFTWEVLKKANNVVYCNLPMYHYLIIATSITRNSSIEKYMKALYGYELMIEDAKTISSECVNDLMIQYIGWNITTFEHIIMQDMPDKNAYRKIVKNLKSCHGCNVSFLRRILMYAIETNLQCGKISLYIMKKIRG